MSSMSTAGQEKIEVLLLILNPSCNSSDPLVRGILTTLTNGFTSTGIFVAYLLGTVLPWRQAALVALTVPLTTMVLVLFVSIFASIFL